jgi:alginate O-acetyltransferase complex protein AlgI
MVFSSYIFLFYFLPAALFLYYLMPRRLKHGLLTMVSYVFYGWANPLFMFLMMASTLIDYIGGLVIAWNGWKWSQPIEILEKGRRRTRIQRLAVTCSICSNLTLLGFFKYFNFAVDNFDALAQWLGLPALGVVMRVTLPLGISFYTFQSMSYAIDVYRGEAKALRNFTDFACFVAMFPQLVAGPIIRFSEVADQLQFRAHTLEKFARGMAFVSLGLFKKIILANPCGKITEVVFNAGSVCPLDAWYGICAYAFQIYFDFSGYSDIAIGLGLMLGFVFPKNFDSPYKSESITEFWRRWHISLSSWLRDYLYIPLGGNRHGRIRTYINLALTMLLGGLWHGAAWNFVIWGGIHGIMLAFERMRGKISYYRYLPRPLRVGLTFLIVLFTWVFFRAPDLQSAFAYFGCMFGLREVTTHALLLKGIIYQPYYVFIFLVAGAVTWFAPQTWDWTRELNWKKTAVIILLFFLSIAVLATQAYNPFIYFIF